MTVSLLARCLLVGMMAMASCSNGGVKTTPEIIDPLVDWVEMTQGGFVFGSPAGTPCRGPYQEKEIPVSLTRSFAMAKTEITQKQWAAMGFPVPQNMPACDNCPIQYVNFFDALAWCNALSRFEGLEECYDLSSCTGEVGTGCDKDVAGCNGPTGAYYCNGKTRKHSSMYECEGYRLPTVAEWEYAAKAGTTTNTYNGNITNDTDGVCEDEPILDEIAWYCFNTSGSESAWQPEYIRQVRTKKPNPWGMHDMLGNAGEWVDFVYTGFGLDYPEEWTGETLIDPMGPTEEVDTRRSLKGGSYFITSCFIRPSFPSNDLFDNRGPGYGFRPVRTLPATSSDAGADSGAK